MGSGGFFYSSCLKGEASPVFFFLLFLENLQILPMGNVRHFRRIHEHDNLFLKMCVFREHLVNSLKNLQILPMGNVRHFRRIHEHETLFLIMCVFRDHLVNLCFFLKIVRFLWNFLRKLVVFAEICGGCF